MASLKDIRSKIESTKNTQQITRAMKMVSAAKLRRAQQNIVNLRPYANGLLSVIADIAGTNRLEHPLLSITLEPKKVLVVVLTSDRGLCGGFNANVIKGAAKFVQANESQYSLIRFGFLGRKGYEFFRNRIVEIGPYFPDLGGKVSFDKATQLADALVKNYLVGEVDEIKIIYNEFKNAASQETKVMNFLPIQSEVAADEVAVAQPPYLVKPSAPQVLEELLAKNFSVQTFRVMLESQAGEHGARMSAMENATKNAGEMIRKLTLQYNKQRQAGITKELLEIISGSESQKG